jgi:membrane protein required for colicin V production
MLFGSYSKKQGIIMIHLTDVFILLLLAWGGYKGFHKGFFTEFLSLLLFVVLTLIGFKLIHAGFNFEKVHDYTSKVPKAVPFFILLAFFIGTSLGLNIWGRKRLEKDPLNVFDTFDNFMGLVFGLIKYTLALSILFWLCTSVGLIQADYQIHNTVFYPLMMKFFRNLLDVSGNLLPFLHDLEQGTKQILRQK